MDEIAGNGEDHQSGDNPPSTPLSENKHPHHPSDSDKKTDKPSHKFKSFVARHWQQWKDIRVHDKLNTLFTIIIAVATVAYVIVTKSTLDEIRNSSPQTEKLITAANTQAGAATKIAAASDRNANAASKSADAADKFATTAAAIDKKIEATEKDFDQMAKNAALSLKATQDSFRDDQRAWLSAIAIMPKIELDKTATGKVRITNHGKTFAIKVDAVAHLKFSPIKLAESGLIPDPGEVEKSLGIFAPGGVYESFLTPKSQRVPIKAVEADVTNLNGTWYTYIWGDMVYFDVFNREHRTKYCWYRIGTADGLDFTQCNMHNCVDDQCKKKKP